LRETSKMVCFTHPTKWILALAVVLPSGYARGADEASAPVSYQRDVLPFLEDQCLACHDEGFETSGLSMATVDSMRKGGRRGPAFVPGKGSESLIIQFLDGTRQPQMPPKTSIPRDQIAVLRRWIEEGAKVDTLDPDDARRLDARKAAEAASFASDAPPPVTSLAYSPDGKRLAVAGYREVVVVDPATGRTETRLGGFADQVTSVAFHPDGLRLAGAGGVAGRQGEVRVWRLDGATWREAGILRGHDDTVLALAWRPKTDQIATASLDRLILVWDATSGKVVRTIKNHSDIVDALAFSADGTRMASGSADKTAKVYDTATGAQVVGLSSHTEAVLSVAFSPDGKHLATGGGDRQIRTWTLANPSNPDKGFGHTGPVYALAWRPDGTSLLAGAGGKPSFLTYKADNGNRVVNIKEETLPQDWVYAVAAAPDNETVAVGGWDGLVSLWSLKTGEKLRSFVPGRVEK
jgi:WD40 repeat protein